MEWINIKDKLPDDREDVLATINGDGSNFVELLFYKDKKFYIWNEYLSKYTLCNYGEDVIAWMYLPEPYKE